MTVPEVAVPPSGPISPTIDGEVTSTVTGSGLNLTKTVTGEITVTKPDGTTASCSVDVTISFGHLSGSVCGVDVSK